MYDGPVTLSDNMLDRVQAFDSHGLSDLSNAKLMDRVDTKFIATLPQLSSLLAVLPSLCSVLSVDGRRISNYKTYYYDAPELQYYKHHHNGALNRYKVRIRNYADQDSSFLEVKFKNNKKRTIKQRIQIDDAKINGLSGHLHFLDACGIQDVDQLSRIQLCNYKRIAFANESTGERLTIDFELAYRDYKNNGELALPNIAIVELKQGRFNHRSALFLAIKKLGLSRVNFSKYCIGVSMLRAGEVKINRFKEMHLKLRKMSAFDSYKAVI